MTPIKILILLQFVFSNSFSQNLSVLELSQLRKNNVAEVEEILTSKNWTYLAGDEPNMDDGEGGMMGHLHFVYQKSANSDRGQSFLHYYFLIKTKQKE